MMEQHERSTLVRITRYYFVVIKQWNLFRRCAPQDKWSSSYMCHLLSPLCISPFLPPLSFLPEGGPGVCGTITATHKGKWVPCVWWRAAASVTQYNHGGIAPGIHLLTLGRGGSNGAWTAVSVSLSLCFAPRPSLGAICRHTADSSDKSLQKCGMGPTSTGVATVFWCFGSLLHSDTKRRGVAPSPYCFWPVSVNGKR